MLFGFLKVFPVRLEGTHENIIVKRIIWRLKKLSLGLLKGFPFILKIISNLLLYWLGSIIKNKELLWTFFLHFSIKTIIGIRGVLRKQSMCLCYMQSQTKSTRMTVGFFWTNDTRKQMYKIFASRYTI